MQPNDFLGRVILLPNNVCHAAFSARQNGLHLKYCICLVQQRRLAYFIGDEQFVEKQTCADDDRPAMAKARKLKGRLLWLSSIA